MTALVISIDEIKDIIKIVKSLEDSGLLLKGVTETFQNEAKEQKGGFLGMLLGLLGASLLGNNLAGKEATATSQGRGKNRPEKGRAAITKSHGRGINRAGKSVIRAGYGSRSSNMDF